MAKINTNYQEKWNEILSQHVPSNLSLAREISELLEVSLDSAYRRLRNDTEYTLAEAAKIANHFNLPLEALNNELHSVVSFKTNELNNNIETYEHYLENMLANVKKMTQFQSSHIYFGAEDIPVYYHYSQENLMRFKITYWLKSLMMVKEFQSKNYGEIEISEGILSLAREIFNTFSKLDSTEIWTTETVKSTIKQIQFYWDAGFFNTINEANDVADDLTLAMQQIQKQAEKSYKFSSSGSMVNSKYQLFISDVMIGTNSILAKTDNISASYISYSTFNFMSTNNIGFNAQNEQWMNNLIARSTLISGVSEKQRNQFFKGVYKQINELKQYFIENL
jgi:hypothetical protein